MTTRRGLSEAMWQALERIASVERDGWLGADPNLIPTTTYLAISRRGLVEPNEDGSVRLSEKGREVEAVLRAAGFVEEDRGDWVRRGVGVYLDIAHAPPETAWVRPGPGERKEVVTYDEVVARFS